jgi:hypothetical protein
MNLETFKNHDIKDKKRRKKEKLDHKQRGTRGPIIGLDGLA